MVTKDLTDAVMLSSIWFLAMMFGHRTSEY
jgi:hypothetical protein